MQTQRHHSDFSTVSRTEGSEGSAKRQKMKPELSYTLDEAVSIQDPQFLGQS